MASSLTFPDLHGPPALPSAEQAGRDERALLAVKSIAIIEKISPQQPTPKFLAETLASDNATEWARAWDAEVIRHAEDPKTWALQDGLDDDKPLPFIMTFRSKKTIWRIEKAQG